MAFLQKLFPSQAKRLEPIVEAATFTQTDKQPHVQYVTNVVVSIILSNILISVLLIVFAIAFVGIAQPETISPLIMTLFIFPPAYMVINLGILRRMQLGKDQYAAETLTLSGFGLIFLATYFSGGLYSPAVLGLVVMFITGIVLVDFTTARWLYALIVAYLVGLLLLDQVGMMPQGAGESALLSFLAAFSAVTAILLIVSYHRYALLESGRRMAALQAETTRFRVQNELTQNLAHDLRTPVSVLKSKMYLIRKRGERGMPVADKLDELETVTDNLHQMIEDLLALTLLDTRSTETEERLHLQAVIQHCIDFVVQAEAAVGVAIGFSDEAGAPIHLVADRTQFERVLQNLLENAIHYGGTQIDVTLQQDDQCIVLQIRDNGVGIAPEYHEKIFERFFRVGEARTMQDGSGTGIGLSIVQKVVQRYGGQIDVVSEPGIGSTFTLQFPRQWRLPPVSSN